MDLPYKAEYSKSGRASCRGCKSLIGQGTLRLAVMVQSPHFDGKTPLWFHYMCFFSKQRPKTVEDIDHFESLRLEDQNKIRERVGNAAAVIIPEKKGKGKKRDASAVSAKKAALADFKIEYSKSSRAFCRGCELKVMKDEIRISKKDFTTEVGMKYGGQDMWHHLTCFAKIRAELGYFESADKLPGFKQLKKEDQTEAKKQLPPIKQEDVPEIKKPKTEDAVDGLSTKESKEYAEQTNLIYKHIDNFKGNDVKKNDLILILEKNNQRVPAGYDECLERVADIMTFGALLPCSNCKNGQFVFKKHEYVCDGSLSDWAHCQAAVKEPERKSCVIPTSLKETFPFLKKYKYKSRVRILKPAPLGSGSSTNGVKKEKDDPDGLEPKVKREAPPLYEMQFVILGRLSRGKDEIKAIITKLGGKVVTKLDKETVMAVISTPSEVEKMNSRMSEVESLGINVVSEDFIDEAKNNVGKIPELIMSKSIAEWGTDPSKRLPQPSTSSMKSKSKSMYTKSMPSKVKLKLKGGTAVDPDSGLEDIAHVYCDGELKYTCVLGLTDIQNNKNSYYKMQILEADKGNQYWYFKSWGRIGTTIGNNKLDKMHTLHEAIQAFEDKYEERTGNFFNMPFMKVPGRYVPLEMDYGEENDVKLDITDTPSNLPRPVQELIRLIFDVNTMKKVMLEFELDTEKMPLGKISKSQIQQAFKVLSKLQDMINKGENNNSQVIASTNQFYTFIPHSFGIDNPPLLNDLEIIKQKLDLLDNLMELEIAYNLMKSTTGEHSVDGYYKQLNTEIDILSHDSEEFRIIQEYVKNTHAASHSSYELIIEDVYTVKRQGEEKRYKPFRKLHNRKLLWHGSRITNYAGILSQGLRIAPPEAPVTGYMFGKGIYFADMVSKSANYCCTSPSNPKGLMLLCEVALGDMYERPRADYIEKLPKGKHSTKGLGMTHPDPSCSKIIDGVEVPCGKGVPVSAQTSLLYNEYIVYDIAQVNVKYLLKMHFKFKY